MKITTKIWERNCPICSKKITYNDYKNFQRAIRKNTNCRSCTCEIKRNLEKPYKRNCPVCGKEIIHNTSKSNYKRAFKKNRPCNSCSQKGKKRTPESIEKQMQKQIGRPCHASTIEKIKKTKILNPYKHSIEAKRKMRVARLKYIETHEGSVYPNFNPEACKIIDEYGKQNGYNFQHALNGGEYRISTLGYYVDGYDKEKNIVIEYYEKFHKKPKQQNRDEIRKQEILNLLGCQFIELKSW